MNLQELQSCKQKTEADVMNDISGNLSADICDCGKCKNKGVIYFMNGDELLCKPCECMSYRDSAKRFRKSGLSESVQRYTFSNFEITQEFQKLMRDKAVNFIKNNGICFFLGGQSGCGKTHLCTAVSGYFLKHGKQVRYLQWRDDTPKIKIGISDGSSQNHIEELKKVDVLYIDDLFKNKEGADPTGADINLAFEIINYRYINSDLITIISSEKTLAELLFIDEAIGSRIAEMSEQYNISIAKDIRKNYRLKEVINI